MRKHMKIASLILAACMILTLAACGKTVDNPSPGTSSTPTPSTSQSSTPSAPTVDTSERVDLVFYVMGDPPVDEQVVEDALNAKLLEKVNATVDFQFSTWTDWAQKYGLQLTTGGADLIYVANWNNYGTYASSGAFLPLEDLLQQYGQDLLRIVDEGLLNQCKVDGTLYAIPNTWPEYTVNGVNYREDLREKYNLPVPNSIENLEKYLLGIKEKEPNQPLLAVTTSESQGLTKAFNAFEVMNFKYPWVTTDGLPYGLAANYETPSDVYDYWKSQDFVEDCKLMKKWADLGFWSKSALSDPNIADAFTQGLCVAEVSGMNPNKNIAAVQTFQNEHPEWKAAYVAFGEATGVIYPAAATQNATAIPRDSKHPDRAMMVLNLLLSDQELNDLVQYGIKGTHYEVTEDGYYKRLSENFNYEAFNTWNLRNNDFKLAQESDKLLNTMFAKYQELGAKTKFPNINVHGNFTEDYTAYQVERGAVSDVMRQYLAPIQAGFVTDVEAAIQDFLQRVDNAGLEKCREGFKAQWLSYCEEYGYK